MGRRDGEGAVVQITRLLLIVVLLLKAVVEGTGLVELRTKQQ